MVFQFSILYCYTILETCKTVGGVIPVNCNFSPQLDKPCVFPFTYKGRTYNECTMDDYDIAWCGTMKEVNKTIDHGQWGNWDSNNKVAKFDEHWGYCAPGCPGSLDGLPKSEKSGIV